MEIIEKIPKEIKEKIFLYCRHNNAQLILDAFIKNKLILKYIPKYKSAHHIWYDLRPSRIGSDVYGGNGMYIKRYKIEIMERMLLFG
tara:strand:+ start:1005 stop:1265 length:261 start_codon:yes stop_codon:yes gene_type:complete